MKTYDIKVYYEIGGKVASTHHIGVHGLMITKHGELTVIKYEDIVCAYAFGTWIKADVTAKSTLD